MSVAQRLWSKRICQPGALLWLVVALIVAGRAGAAAGVNEQVFRGLSDANRLIEAEAYPQALSKLESLRSSRLVPYEHAQILRLVGLVHYRQDALDESRAAYEEALAQRRLPDSMIANLLGTLGRIGLMQADYRYAVDRLVGLLSMDGHGTAENRVLLANAYLRLETFDDALSQLQAAIREQREQGLAVPENWLSMLAATHYSLEDYDAMAGVLRELIQRYPRERYFLNLAAIYGQEGQRERQLALIEALHSDDRLERGSQLRMLINLYLAVDLPYKAAALLERAVDVGQLPRDQANLEQLSQAWYLARETDRALAPLAKAAAMAESGELYLRLAGLYMDSYDWSQATAAVTEALELGGLEQEGNAWLLRGMAEARQERFSAARESFRRAQQFDESERYAAQWLAYVAAEQKKQATRSDVD